MDSNKKRKKKDPRNIGGIPYNFRELIKWIFKHATVDFYYPFMLLIYFMFVTSVVTVFTRRVRAFWYIFFTIGFLIFAILFFQRMVKERIHKIENIGKMNEDGWREFEFNDLNSNFPQLKPEETIYRIGFVGDIMKMEDYDLEFEKRIQKFFGDVDLIVGNLEGIILSDENIRGGVAAQHHKEDILLKLRKIFQTNGPQEVNPIWLLCISNNHSADYGDKEFIVSKDLINQSDMFITFGDRNSQRYEWGINEEKDDINFVTGTMWSNNKITPSIARFTECEKFRNPDKFNILFPHWHFENECYVRAKIQRRSISLKLTNQYENRNWLTIYELIRRYTPEILFDKIEKKLPFFQRISEKLPYFKTIKISETKKYEDKWNIIYGHHSHVPQPIMNYGTGILAYSGGNFTSSKRRKKHISGLIMKCEIGRRDNSGPLVLGKVYWCYTINERKKLPMGEFQDNNGKTRKKKKREVTVVIDCKRTRKNYFENRGMRFRMNLIIFSIALGGWLGYFWIFFSIHFIYWILYTLLIIFEIIYAILKNIKLHRK